jgi:ABC-2 type transport system permease protein
MIPFLLMASFAGIMATLFLMRLFPSKGVRDVFIFLGVFLLAGLYILFRFMQPERLVRPDGLEVISHYLSYLEAPTASYLPSWWVTAGMYSAVSGKIPAFLGYLSLLCASAGFLLWLLLLAADKVYFAGWTQGSIISRRKALKKHLFGAVSGLSALFKKDRLTFFRNTGEWTQLLVLGAIVVVYLFSIYKVPLDTLYLQNLLSYVNIALIGFILSAVALRLVFPSISIEGRNMWLLFSSPLGRAKLYWSKLLFGILPVLIMGMVLVILSNLLLKADYTVFWMTTEAVVIMSIGLPCMATAFGSAFPRFDLENTAQIESSLGGIFYIITALFYIAVNMSLWSMPVQNYYRVKFMMRHLPSGYFYKIYAVILIFNLFVFVFCTWFGIKRLKKMEI